MPAPTTVLAAPEPSFTVGSKEHLPDKRIAGQEAQGRLTGLGQRLPAQTVIGGKQDALLVADKEAGRSARRAQQEGRRDPLGQKALLPMLTAVGAEDKPTLACQPDPIGFAQYGLDRSRRPIGPPVGAAVGAQTDAIAAGQADDTLLAGLDEEMFGEEIKGAMEKLEGSPPIERTVKAAVLGTTGQGEHDGGTALTPSRSGLQFDQLQPAQTASRQAGAAGDPAAATVQASP